MKIENSSYGSIYQDYAAAFTRIGNALGLKGSFPVHFGYEQIEVRSKAVVDGLRGLVDEAYSVSSNKEAMKEIRDASRVFAHALDSILVSGKGE